MREYAARRGWTIAMQVREVGSGAAQRQAREKLLEAARRREIDVVLVWRLDRWGRSVTDLLATLQELEHLGVGFVSLTEALDLTTPAGRAMAGLLAIFAEFEREILRERTRAGLAHARQNGKRLGRPATAAVHAAEIRKLHRRRRQQIRNRSPGADRPHLGPPHPGSEVMKRPKRDPIREDRIHNEAIVDATGPEEQAMSWYYYLESKITFPVPGEVYCSRRMSRRSGKAKPSKSYAWPLKMSASTTCLCRSVGRGGKWLSLFPNWPPSIPTNPLRKPSATGITGWPRATCSESRPQLHPR